MPVNLWKRLALGLVVVASTVSASRFLLAEDDRWPRSQDSPAAASSTVPMSPTGFLLADTDRATGYYVQESGVPGPTVMIVAGMHGNEPAGYRAAEQIRTWPIQRGKLIVIPAANTVGLERGHRRLSPQRGDQFDLNRHFPRDNDEPQLHSELGDAIWQLTQELSPEFVLDLHEGFEFNISHQPREGQNRSVGSTLIYRTNNRLDELTEQMLERVNQTISDEDRKFRRLSRGPVRGSWVAACRDVLGIDGIIVETTYKDQPLSLRTRQHRLLCSEVLRSLEMVSDACQQTISNEAEEATIVGLFDGPGTTARGIENLTKILDDAPSIRVHHFGPNDVSETFLAQFDLIVFPGGSGSAQARALGEQHRETVRQYIANGGDCIGICAGAYLCSAHYNWSLHVINTSVFTGSRQTRQGPKQMWYRGPATTVEIELTEAGEEVFQGFQTRLAVRYQNGPIVAPKDQSDLPPYRVLAYFRSENGLYEPQTGTMIDTAAIVTSRFGAGDVVSVSPHPEATDSLRGMIIDLIDWCQRTDDVERVSNVGND